MRNENQRQGALQSDGWFIQTECVHQQIVDGAAWPNQGSEGHRYDHRRQHEGQRRQRQQRGLARKLIARKDVRPRNRQRQRQRGGEGRLPDREP